MRGAISLLLKAYLNSPWTGLLPFSSIVPHLCSSIVSNVNEEGWAVGPISNIVEQSGSARPVFLAGLRSTI